MQPYSTALSHTLNALPKVPRKRKQAPKPPIIVEETAEESTPTKDHYSRPEKSHAHSNASRKRGNKSAPRLPLLTDARTEHLLLAARKIGRERAGIVSGLMEAKEKAEQRKKVEDVVGLTTGPPKTPRKLAPASHGTPQFVYMNSPVRGGHGSPGSTSVPMLVPYQMVSRTPGASTSAGGVASPSASTPGLDSLLSAARSIDLMNSDQPGGTRDGNGKARDGMDVDDEPESPVPKRRKTGGATTTIGEGQVGSGRSC
jgi:hypothetical protein